MNLVAVGLRVVGFFFLFVLILCTIYSHITETLVPKIMSYGQMEEGCILNCYTSDNVYFAAVEILTGKQEHPLKHRKNSTNCQLSLHTSVVVPFVFPRAAPQNICQYVNA